MNEEKVNQHGSSLSRAIEVIEKMPGSQEILKAIAPTINWAEEALRYIDIGGRSEKYQDKAKPLLFQTLSESSLISLISPRMFKEEFSGYDAVPYFFCMSRNKFKFLTAYIEEFNNYLIEKKDTHGLDHLNFSGHSRSQFLPAVLTAFRDTHKDSHHLVIAFDSLSTSSVSAWFENVYSVLEKLASINPIFKDLGDKETIPQNSNQAQSKEARAREKKNYQKASDSIQKIWIASLYLANPQEPVQKFSLMPKSMKEGKAIDFDEHVLPFLYQSLNGLAKEGGFTDREATLEQVNQSFFDYIASKQELASFKELIKDLSVTSKLKNKAEPVLEHIARSVASKVSFTSRNMFVGRRGMSYGSKEMFDKELVRDISYFSNVFEKFSFLLNNAQCKAWITDEIKSKEEDKYNSLSKNALDCLAQQAPLPLMILKTIEPEHTFEVAGKKRSIAQTVFLYKLVQDVILNAKLKNKTGDPFIDYRNHVDIAVTLDKKNSGGSQYDKHFSVDERYVIRRQQYLQSGAPLNYVPDFSELEPLINALTIKEKEEVLAYVRNNISQALELPGFDAMNYKIEDMPSLQITIEKLVLDFKIDSGAEAKPDNKAVLKI